MHIVYNVYSYIIKRSLGKQRWSVGCLRGVGSPLNFREVFLEFCLAGFAAVLQWSNLALFPKNLGLPSNNGCPNKLPKWEVSFVLGNHPWLLSIVDLEEVQSLGLSGGVCGRPFFSSYTRRSRRRGSSLAAPFDGDCEPNAAVQSSQCESSTDSVRDFSS